MHLQERMCRHVVEGDALLMLPCCRRRPYADSRTHSRIRLALPQTGVPSDMQRVVVTALGVVPEAFWRDPLVMSYDAGAVDLWRVYQFVFGICRTESPDCHCRLPLVQALFGHAFAVT